jgi:hypothetical protein
MAPGYAGIIADTLRMAAMLGFPEPKPLALYDDWLALHNRYSVELCVKRDARRIQRFNEELGPNEIVTGAWRFERLMTGEQLVEEGEAMHHCVGSYMDACLENRYLVYRAFKDGKHVGTLGMRPNEGVGAVIDQFMGPCNTPLQLSSTEPRQMRAAFTGYPL